MIVLITYSCGTPNLLFERTSTPTQARIFDRHHLCRRCPVVGVRVCDSPLFFFGFVFVLLPKIANQSKEFFRGPNLFVANFGVILHTLGLSQTHFKSILFGGITSFAFRTEFFHASLDEFVVRLLTIPQYLYFHPLVSFRNWKSRILIVW